MDTPEYTAFRAFLAECLMRHHQGDCGDMGDGDKGLNDAAIISGDRVFSMYQLPEAIAEGCPDPKIWIITDASDDPAKRFATTIMFPSEY